MSSAEKENNSDRNVAVAERLHAIRERLARRVSRPVLAAPQLNLRSLELLKNMPGEAGQLAGAIGTVNPRRPGLANELIQAAKRSLARGLDWMVRPQRDFNRSVLAALARTAQLLEAANQTANRNMQLLAEATGHSASAYRAIGDEIDSVCEHFDRQIEAVEEKIKLQRWAYEGALARQSTTLQDRMYSVLEEAQDQTTKILDDLRQQMRTLRLRVAAQSRAETVRAVGASLASSQPATSSPAGIDYFRLELHFRGSEEEIRTRQSFYVPFFAGRKDVLDIACGRGEFLDLLREANVPARGVDIDADMIGRCLEKSLNVVQADVLSYLDTVPDRSLDGIFCAQFVEHVEVGTLVRLLEQCARKLAPSGILVIETPNPECLAIFSQTFYLDPTHVRPVPPALLRVLLGEGGFEQITTHFLSPVSERFPAAPLPTEGMQAEAVIAWNSAVAKFNETFFGGMDYAVIGYRAGS